MKKNFWEWIAYIFLFIWQIPQNIIGFVMWAFFKICGDAEPIVKNKYSKVYRSKYMSGGISLGCFAFVSNYSSTKKEIVMHEQGHMWDSKVMGPLYLLIVGLPSMLNAAFDFTECYYDWFPEKLANKHAGIYADENCVLHIKEEKQ